MKHLLINILHRHLTSEHCGDSKISSVARIARRHHVLGVEELLSELWDGERPVLRRTSSCQWRESRHEEMKSRERNHIDSEFSEVSIELTGKSKASSDARHCRRNEMVQVAVGWVCQLQCAEANVVERLIVDAVSLVSILDQLMDRKSRIVRFNDGMRLLEMGRPRTCS